MLARRKIALLDGALIRQASLTFEKELGTLAPAQAGKLRHSILPKPTFFTGTAISKSRPAQCCQRKLRDFDHTLRRFGGRHPLCGIGVTSLMSRTSSPAVANARTADSRPAPGPLTRTSTRSHTVVAGAHWRLACRPAVQRKASPCATL